MEKKYIVELGDENVRSVDGYDWLQLLISVADKSVMVETAIELLPYTEPDMEKVRKEAYDKGYDDATAEIGSDEQAIAEKAYQKGLSDAWEAARKIVLSRDDGGIEYEVKKEIFGHTNYNIIRDFNVSEVIEEIRAHEQAQKEQESITTEDVMRQYLDTFCMHNKGCAKCPLNTPDFTCGRGYHFTTSKPVSDEEVRRAYATVLAKMKES